MATFSTNKRLLKIYERLEGNYIGFGPAGGIPSKLRVQGKLLQRYDRLGKEVPAKLLSVGLFMVEGIVKRRGKVYHYRSR